MSSVIFSDLKDKWKVDAAEVGKRSGADLSDVEVNMLRRDIEPAEVEFTGFDVNDVEGGKAAVLSWLRSMYTVKIVRGTQSSLTVVLS